jgi:hypothetical protein
MLATFAVCGFLLHDLPAWVFTRRVLPPGATIAFLRRLASVSRPEAGGMNPELGQSMSKASELKRNRFAKAWQLGTGSVRPLGACSKLRFASLKSDVQLFFDSWS